MSNTIEQTKIERNAVYGDYKGGSTFRSGVMSIIRDRYVLTNNGATLHPFYEVMIFDIVNKLSRIAVTPSHLDSWHDISVYANLAEEVVNGLEQSNANK